MNFNEQDIDTAARTLWGECRGEPQAGQIAVAWVIRNRAERKRFAGTLAGQAGAVDRVCKAKWQFSCWWDQQASALAALSPQRIEAQAELVRGVLGGITPDPTNGADHYHTIARPGYADVWPPNWAPTMAEVARFGGHVFYDSRLPAGAAPMHRPATEVPAGYEVTPTGNVINPNPSQGTIVKDANKGEAASWANAAWGFAAPALGALQGLDWRVVAVLGGVSIVLAVAAIFYFRGIRKTRMEMAKQGVV
jgi:hypothetical protein